MIKVKEVEELVARLDGLEMQCDADLVQELWEEYCRYHAIYHDLPKYWHETVKSVGNHYRGKK